MNLYCLMSKPKPLSNRVPTPSDAESKSNAYQLVDDEACGLDAVIVVVIGSTEFRESRRSLRSWSDYFDEAFRSQPKLTRFDFPGRSPKEWAWIVSLMSPLSTDIITLEKLPIALDWFRLLRSTRGLQECDKTMSQGFLDRLVGKDSCISHIGTVIQYLDTCLTHNLPTSKKRCFSILRHALIRCPSWFAVNKTSLYQITRLIKDHQECHQELWSVLKVYIPPSITEDKQTVLLQNNLLHEFIYLEMSLRQTLSESLSVNHGTHNRAMPNEQDIWSSSSSQATVSS